MSFADNLLIVVRQLFEYCCGMNGKFASSCINLDVGFVFSKSFASKGNRNREGFESGGLSVANFATELAVAFNRNYFQVVVTLIQNLNVASSGNRTSAIEVVS